MYEIKKTFEISAAHKLALDYPSKCTELHGHNWIVTVYLRAEKLNAAGMIMDFTEIKKKISERLDHKILNDVLDFNPTAENMAKFICDELGAACYKVDVQESEGNVATYTHEKVCYAYNTLLTPEIPLESRFYVVEMFESLEGEGKRAGAVASFIRLAGCNLRCSYCDTTHALTNESAKEMTLGEILSWLNKKIKNVTLTGGEPLNAPGVEGLVRALILRGHEVNIETNGSVDITNFAERVGDRERSRLFFTMDYKLPASGVCDKMHKPNFIHLHCNDVIKFVVGSQVDVDEMLRFLVYVDENVQDMPQIYIGAVYGAFGLPDLAEVILKNPILRNARLQVQLHKIIWGPDKQGV